MNLKKKRVFKVAEMVEKKIFDALQLCTMEGQYETIQTTVLLPICSKTRNVFYKEVAAGNT